MYSRLRVTALAALVAATMALPTPAPAQTAPGSSGRVIVPTVLWAATGAVLGAVAWPLVFPGTVATGAGAAGAPGAAAASVWTWNSFVTTRAAVGAAIGAVFGYTIAR